MQTVAQGSSVSLDASTQPLVFPSALKEQDSRMNILRSVLGRFSRDLGIDLGTANTLVHVRGRGILLREPSVVAIEKENRKILAVGEDAKRMLGRTPGNIVTSRSIRIAGDEMDEAIASYVRRTYNLFIGDRTSEMTKFEIGSAFPTGNDRTLEIRGRDLITGLPRSTTITSAEIREAIHDPV